MSIHKIYFSLRVHNEYRFENISFYKGVLLLVMCLSVNQDFYHCYRKVKRNKKFDDEKPSLIFSIDLAKLYFNDLTKDITRENNEFFRVVLAINPLF